MFCQFLRFFWSMLSLFVCELSVNSSFFWSLPCFFCQCLFPTLTCGVFVFSAVSAPSSFLPPCPPNSPTNPLTHSHTHSLTQSLTHSLSLTHSHSLSLTHSHSLTLTHSHSLSLTHSHSLTLTHSLSLTLTHSLTRSLAHSLTHSLFCVAGAGLGALERGRMYALASLRCPLVSAALPAAFAWQARDLVHCKGVGCTPWRPSGVPWSPPLCRWLLRGRRGTLR